MPKIHGKNAQFWITDANGTERNLSPWLNTIEMPSSIETAEVTTYGDLAKSFVNGLQSATIRGAGFASFGANEIDQILNGLKNGTAVPTFKFAPAGSAVGNIFYSGSCIITNYSVSAPLSGAVTCSFDAQITGPVTRGTFA